MIKTINFDMDGVLVDLSKNMAKLDGYDDPVLWYIHKFDIDGYDMYPKSIERHIDSDCFVTCPPMPYYESMKNLMLSLHNRGYKINILSSCMDKPYSEKITEQKLKWLDIYYKTEMQFFNEINIVKGSTLKINYIDDDAILIDDYLRTRTAFIEAGMGDQFIHYTNFNDMLKQLNEKNII